jgi:hypothetical protein
MFSTAAPLLALSLIGAALHPGGFPPPPSATLQSQAQKERAFLTAVQRNTACIVQEVTADSRWPQADLGDLIVDAMEPCRDSARDIIDTYDRLKGSGGEEFFYTKYLDFLPGAVRTFTSSAGH